MVYGSIHLLHLGQHTPVEPGGPGAAARTGRRPSDLRRRRDRPRAGDRGLSGNGRGGRPARLLNLNEERDAERNQVDELLDEEEEQHKAEEPV